MNDKLCVLIVEDSEDDTLLLVRHLKKNGYDVVYECVDTALAMEVALKKRSDWQLIISDYSMPQFSGLEAIKLVKTLGLDIPIIIISGVMGEETAVSAMRAGAHDYIMKGHLARLVPAIERELQEAEAHRIRKWAEYQVQRLSGALEQSKNFVLITNHENVIEYTNQAFSYITDYHSEEITGLDITQWQPANTLTSDSTTIAKVVADGLDWSGEMQLLSVSDELCWLSVVVSPIKDDDGAFTGALVIMDDISQRKCLEQQLRDYTVQLEAMVESRTAELSATNLQLKLEIEERKQTQKELEKARDQALHALRFKQQILVNMHHEIRTPLSIINTKLYLLRQRLYGDLTDKQEDALTVIDMEGYMLLNVLDNLLDLAQIETGGIELQPDAFSPIDLVRKVIKRAIPLATEKNLEVIYRVEPSLSDVIYGDFRRLSRMLFNLVDNAVRFTEVGVITIRLYQPNHYQWAMQVTDTGPGIPAEVGSDVFQPFWQMDGSDTRTSKRGVGLGLTMVHKLVQSVGGEVLLAQNQPTGTIVEVLLPIE